MIQIRSSQFETNSSSTHVFCIPSTKSLKIPKEIKLSSLDRYVDITTEMSIEDRIAYMYDRAKDNNSEASFIEYLKAKGINVIDDRKYEFDGYMFNFDFTESQLDSFLFDPDSKFLLDDDIDEYKHLEDEGYQLIVIRE